MAQWDACLNPSARLRDEIPFLVDLQSDLLSGLTTRLVAPLARSRLGLSGVPRRLCPAFTIDGTMVVPLPPEAGPVDARLLRHPVASLRSRSHDVVDAFDDVVSGV